MATVYNLFYQGDFCNDAGDDIFVKFYRKMDSGDPVPTPIDIVFGGGELVQITYKDEGENKLNPIYGSAATILIKAIGDFELSEMYSEDERSWKCVISGAWNWQGWVLPDGCNEPYDSKPYDVTVECTDAVGTLKTVPFLKEDLTKYTDYEQDRNILYDILKKTGLELPIGHAVNTFESTMDTNVDPLAQCYPNTLAYQDIDDVPFSCYDVLKSIMQRWSCVLRQVDGMWQMVNVLEKSRGNVNMWVYDETNTVDAEIEIGNEVTAGGSDRVFSPSDANKSLSKAYKATTAYYKYGYPSNELLNPDFNEGPFPPALPDNWIEQGTVTASTALVIDPETSAATNNRYLLVSAANEDAFSFIVTDTPVLVRASDQVNISIDTRWDSFTTGLGANTKVHMDLYLATEDGWYFTEDSGWQTRQDTYRIVQKARDVFGIDYKVKFSIAPRFNDYTLIIGVRCWQHDGVDYPTKFDNVQLASTNPIVISKPPIGVYMRHVQRAALTYTPETILMLHSDDPNTTRNSRISIGPPSPVTNPVAWSRWDIFGEDKSLMHIVANSQLRLHQKTCQIFEAIFTRNNPLDTTKIDPNTLFSIDLLSGQFLMLSGTFNLKSGNHNLRLAEVFTDEVDYYIEYRHDFGTEKDKDGISIGSPGGVTVPPVSNGTGSDSSYVQPEIIPFDFSVTPVTSIDMTINGRNIFGKYPKVEIWNTIDADNESLYPGQYAIERVLDAGVLTEINFPDLTMDFAPSQTGYFKLSK